MHGSFIFLFVGLLLVHMLCLKACYDPEENPRKSQQVGFSVNIDFKKRKKKDITVCILLGSHMLFNFLVFSYCQTTVYIKISGTCSGLLLYASITLLYKISVYIFND